MTTTQRLRSIVQNVDGTDPACEKGGICFDGFPIMIRMFQYEILQYVGRAFHHEYQGFVSSVPMTQQGSGHALVRHIHFQTRIRPRLISSRPKFFLKK